MLSVNELRNSTTFLFRDQAHQVVSYAHVKMGRGGAVIRLKLRNLESGAVFEETFKNNDSVDEISIISQPGQFLYQDGSTAYFMNTNSFDQLSIAIARLGATAKFLRDGAKVDLLFRDDNRGSIVAVKLPTKIELTVIETAPNVKGATASRVTKPATLEGGAVVNVPSFVKIGDVVRVNTESGEYVERV